MDRRKLRKNKTDENTWIKKECSYLMGKGDMKQGKARLVELKPGRKNNALAHV